MSAAPVRDLTQGGDGTRAPLLRDVLRTQVKESIMRGIIEGRYPPGARLIETRIARELGVSQAPVREALRDLENVGVIDSLAFKGARVRLPSSAELIAAFPVRAALESLAAAEAARRMGEPELRRLDDLIVGMVDAAHRGDVHYQSVANASFHALIVQSAGNPVLERQWALLEPFARTYLTATKAHVDLVWIAERHRNILDPLRRRDSQAAADAMRDHLMEACRWLRQGDCQ
ncbi:MAG: GntR family transcriptional regulator [Candidatus Dormibacteraeota bacterium]|nr:GntR family transcriptional regulator [Candidatus Dormibacteraeota bacterium]